MTEPADPIRVLCAFDEAYSVPAAVTLRSIARTLRPDERCVAHVVGVDLRDDTRRRIEMLGTEQLQITWLSFDHRLLDALPESVRPRDSYLNDTVYVRLFLDALLPDDVARVIVIDVDTLVRRSLADLWAIDVTDAVLAAAFDVGVPAMAAPTGPAHWRRLRLEPTAPYLNAGVLLINRARWRDAGVQSCALAYIADPANDVRFHDQEALNVCLGGQWMRLPLEWNAQSAEIEFVVRSGVRWLWAAIAPDELETARLDPAVVHFAGERKPWHVDSRVPWRDDWFDVLEETPWAGQGPTRRSRAPVRALRVLERRLRRASWALRRG